MNPLIQLKRAIAVFLVAQACFGLSTTARALSPPPDGGYSNFTTAEGDKALFSLTSGAGNTALGWRSLFSNTTGNFNTGVGGGALALNIGDSNTAVGAAALLLNIPGHDNTAVGVSALLHNFSGAANTAVGSEALLFNDQTGHGVASGNTAVGQRALFNNIDASANTAVGSAALTNNDSTGNALAVNNTAVGTTALFNNTDGTNNTATGFDALSSNTIGNGNTAIGIDALLSNTIGSENTAIGSSTLSNNTSGASNTALGIGAGAGVTTASDVICIGFDIAGANVDNSCFIGNIFGQQGGSQAVFVDANGKLGLQVSSRRFKDEIKPIEQDSDVIYRLNPVSFRYKANIDPARPLSFGLIAEDVEQVSPDLVIYSRDGHAVSVRYDAVNAMLLNEFLKEHRTVQEQKATIAELRQNFAQQQKQIEALTTGLQKVSAQVAGASPSLADLK